MKKIISFILIATIINSILLSNRIMVLAKDNVYNLTETRFDVQTWLDIDGDKNSQNMEQYYEQTKKCPEGPIICFAVKTLDFATQIIGSIAVILIIISGFMLMLAQGNDQKLNEAKDIAKYAVIGLIITISSYIISLFVQGIFTSRT